MSNQIDKMAPPASASTHVAKPMRKASAPVADPAQQAPNLNQPVATATRLGHSFGNIGVHYGAPPVGSQPIIQPKLTIGPVNDPYEQEADRVAAQVVNQVNTPTAQRQEKPEDEEKLQTKPLISSLQRQETPEDEEKLQTKPITDSLQRQEEPEKEDEQVQTKSLAASLQRQEKPEDEEKVQTKPLIPSLQRQEMPEEEEKLQTKPIADLLQRQEEPEQEEEQVQTKSLAASLQRQEKPEDEEKLQTKPLLNPIQRQAEKEEDKLQTKPQLQRQADGSMAAPPSLESAISGMRGSGQSLPDSTRQPMERAFGADFSKVKVHTDAQADQLNRSVQARAFTTGQDIFFRQGEHSPNTPAGQELLAHELTHVVQQNTDAIQPARNLVQRARYSVSHGTSDERKTVNSALNRAERMANRAQMYMGGTQKARYKTWYDANHTPTNTAAVNRFANVKRGWVKVYDVFQSRKIYFDCSARNENYYAEVDTSDGKYKVKLGKDFWGASLTGRDSKGGAIIHEISHEEMYTDDHKYGEAQAKALAQNKPNDAVSNADNWEYFAEDSY